MSERVRDEHSETETAQPDVKAVELKILQILLWLIAALPFALFLYFNAEIQRATRALPPAQHCHQNRQWPMALAAELQRQHPQWPEFYRELALFQARLYRCQLESGAPS